MLEPPPSNERFQVALLAQELIAYLTNQSERFLALSDDDTDYLPAATATLTNCIAALTGTTEADMDNPDAACASLLKLWATPQTDGGTPEYYIWQDFNTLDFSHSLDELRTED